MNNCFYFLSNNIYNSFRYKNMTNSVVSRGKMLHAAVHSLQSFDRSLDQFLAWLSEAESLSETAEDIDRNPMSLKVRTFLNY